MGRYMKEKPAFMPKLDQTHYFLIPGYTTILNRDIDSKHSS